MKYFGYLNESSQVVLEDNNDSIPDDFIIYDEQGNEIKRKKAFIMNGERQNIDDVAYDDGNWRPRQYSKEELIEQAELKKAELIANASTVLIPLQDAVDLEMATDEEISKLKQWKTYRVLLNRVDTSLAPDIIWPEMPE